MLCSLLYLTNVALAQDVLLPGFTPRSTDEIIPAIEMYEVTLQALRLEGLDVVDADGLREELGSMSEGCAQDPTCPYILLQTFPARIVLVGSVQAESGGTFTRIEIFGANDRTPIETLERTLSAGEGPAFAQEISQITAEVLTLVPARTFADRPSESVPVPASSGDHPPPPPPRAPTRTTLEASPDRAQAPAADPRDRSSRVQIRLGPAFGDVHQQYDVILAIEPIASDSY
ncbi:MAG: hypothetical protein QGG40_22490, partial [Myxococcota bacterium]|nr:hypothetical protein [Myxococcota bacterium]